MDLQQHNYDEIEDHAGFEDDAEGLSARRARGEADPMPILEEARAFGRGEVEVGNERDSPAPS